MLDSEAFRQWISDTKLTMFCPGIPGSGKTLLTSIVIDHLQIKFAKDPEVGIAFTYCNFRKKAGQSAHDLLASILRQLLFRVSELPSEVEKTYEACQTSRKQATFQELIVCLGATLSSFSRTFIVIDALDESLDSRDGRDSLLAELFKLQQATSSNIFATSRFIPDIEIQFEGSLIAEIQGHEDDIRSYLISSMTTLRPFVKRDAGLQEEILDAILNSVDGM